MTRYGFVADPRSEVAVPACGILSRTIHEDERLSLVVFAFDAGQKLSEHTSARAAVIEVLTSPPVPAGPTGRAARGLR